MPERYRYPLRISGIRLCMELDHPLPAEDAFTPFLTEDGEMDFTARFRQVDALPPIPEQTLYEDNCYRVHPDGKGGYVRSFFDGMHSGGTYALGTYDLRRGCITIDYLPWGEKFVSELSNSFFHMGLEGLLIRKDRLCFHAACVDTPLGGILFSGPSGVGKSTQAQLWCRHRGSRQINGDRPILSNEDGVWTAWGSPYAGSSRVWRNENCPIRAMVLLKQGVENRCRRLGTAEAFRGIYAGLTMYTWSREFTDRALDLAMDLAARIPALELSCTPDERAVDHLEQVLREEIKP